MAENPFLVFKNAAQQNRSRPVLLEYPAPRNLRATPFTAIDQTGAPAKVRAAVASVSKADDKLKALRKFYPDAVAYGADNFVFTDPKTKRPTIFNPKGVDRGDFVEQGRLAANVVGGALGAAGGSVVAPGAGTLLGGSAGATAGGVLYDKAIQKLTGAEDTRTFGQQAVDAATETALDLVLTKAGSAAVRGGRNLLRSGDSAAVDAFKNLNVQPPVVASGSKGAKMVGGFLEAQLGSSGRVTERTARAVDEVGGVLKQKVAETTSAASRKDAGDIVKNAAEKFIEDGQKKANQLYARVDELIPANSRVPLANFTQKLDELNNVFSGSPEWEAAFATPDIKRWFEIAGQSAQSGGVEYGALKEIRSRLGGAISGRGPLANSIEEGELKSLYRALTADMEDAARIVAGDDGVKAVTDASGHWQNFRNIVDTQITPTLFDGKKALPSEKVYTNFISRVENAPSTLGDWANVIPAEKRTELGAFLLRDGAKPRPRVEGALADTAEGSTFSPTEFVFNFNKRFNTAEQAPAREFFFGQKPELLETGQNVFTASNALKGAATETNSSRTAAVGGITGAVGGIPALLLGGTDAGLTGAVVAPAAATAASVPLGRLFTSPTVERLMTRPAIEATPWTVGQATAGVGLTSAGLRPLTMGESNAETMPVEDDENPFLQFAPN